MTNGWIKVNVHHLEDDGSYGVLGSEYLQCLRVIKVDYELGSSLYYVETDEAYYQEHVCYLLLSESEADA